MIHQLTRLRPRRTESHSKYDIVESAFEQPEQILSRSAPLPRSLPVIVAKLPFQHTIHSPQLLLFPQLQRIVGKPSLTPLPMLTRGCVQFAFRIKWTSTTRKHEVDSFTPTEPTPRTCVSRHWSLSPKLLYTRRFFGARHPLWGMGVTSEILVILNPALFNARTADSRPGPGPLTITSKFFTPYSVAASHALEAAICAANGVLFLDPLNPLAPAVDQAKALPWRSVIVIKVLLNDACTCAIPSLTVRRMRFLARAFDLAIAVSRIYLLMGRRGPFLVRPFVCVRCPRTGNPLR